MNNLDELVKIYLTIRNERERVEAEWKARDKEFENDFKAFGYEMIDPAEFNRLSLKNLL